MLEGAQLCSDERLDIGFDISERTVLALAELYEEWCEAEGNPFDIQHFIGTLVAHIGEGALVPVVLWDGDKPAGAAMMQLFREMFSPTLAAMLGQLYIRPEYRGSRKGAELGMQLIHMAEWLGATSIRVPARPETANYYWRSLPPGYAMTTVIFSKETR